MEIEGTDNKTIEYTMGMGKVNLIAILMAIPISVITILPYQLIWGYETLKPGKEVFMKYFLIYLLAGVVVHELLHGITWGLFAKSKFKAIRFGIKWKYLTPYCHCKEPLKVKHYRLGGAMPLIVMGIIPVLLGWITGNGGILTFGIFFTWAAGGDIIALFMLRKLDNEIYVSDHPSKMGFIREME